MKRIALFLSVGAVAMLLASVAMAQPDGKVTICHIPPGNPANAHTISVGASAVPAHINHGDTLGSCTCEDPPASCAFSENGDTCEPNNCVIRCDGSAICCCDSACESTEDCCEDDPCTPQ